MELERHKKFNKFLEDVVNIDKQGDNKEFEGINDLQDRFKNLKNENRKLMQRVCIWLDDFYDFIEAAN